VPNLSRFGSPALPVAIWLVTACTPSQPAEVSPERQAAREAARSAIVNERSLDAATLPPQSLGIPPFQVSIVDTMLAALGYGLADLLTTDLARSAQLQVVDRLRLDAVLREIHLAESGRVDTATAPRVGKLIQARRLVLGGLGQIPGGDLSISAGIADVATGELREAVTATASLDAILPAEKELAFRLLDQLGVILSPAERSAVEQLPTKNIAALLAYSRGVRFELEGRYPEAKQEYQHAVQLDPGFQQAQEHLEGIETTPRELAPVQQASAGPVRAGDVVTDRINEIFYFGNPAIVSPSQGGDDIQLPTTIIITVQVQP
jgi:tetratricopeptide (TPR) repeat protein